MPDLRQHATRHDEIVAARLDRLVPDLMDRAGLDAWVVAAREYNEDPVMETMLPATWLGTARRRTILVFLRRPDTVERMAVARYAVGDLFPAGWDPTVEPDQWKALVSILEAADPATIGVDRSSVFPFADGLSASEHDAMIEALPHHLRERVVSAETAAVGWLETRTPVEIELMGEACRTSHGFLRRALSGEVIEPGTTTTGDVEWWLRQTVHAAGYGSWFHPTVSVQRRGGDLRSSFATKPGEITIERGDLVHVDFGIVADGYCTDQQQHAYVLETGETSPPAGILAGMAAANRLQDVLMAEFRPGRTGNQVLAAARAEADRLAIDGLFYTHPIGVHGHGAGPTIGLWDRQEGVPGQGDYSLRHDTAFSIELQARLPVPEWDGRPVQFMLEEDAVFTSEGCRFLDGRQTEPWTV